MMSPLRQFKSLYSICLDQVLQNIELRVDSDLTTMNVLRNYFLQNLHGGIREDLIHLAIANRRFQDSHRGLTDILDVIELLADFTTRKIELNKNGDFLTEVQKDRLFSILCSANVLGLHALQIKIPIEYMDHRDNTVPDDLWKCDFLQKALRRGLANNLRVITLHNAANNRTLKVLGKYAPQLTILDISSSWYVNDFGIVELLLRGKYNWFKEHYDEFDAWEPDAVELLENIPKASRNKTCETLREVRIQDSCTTPISLMLLLMFCSNLRSFGGYVYYRNIGDAVLKVMNRKKAPTNLKLTELCDTTLPAEKLSQIAKFLPNLSTLNTLASYLPQTSGILPPLTNLTVDINFTNYTPLLYYLIHSGTALRRLALTDEGVSINIVELLKLCPNLEDITAKVDAHNADEPIFEYKYIRRVKLQIFIPITFNWVLHHCPNIEELEIIIQGGEHLDTAKFHDYTITEIIKQNPVSLQSIWKLNICASNTDDFYGSLNRVCLLSISSALALCNACSKLRYLGKLHSWVEIKDVSEVEQLALNLRRQNRDVKLFYKDDLYPLW